MAPTTCACANWKTAQQDGSDDAEEAVDGEKDNDEVEIEMLRSSHDRRVRRDERPRHGVNDATVQKNKVPSRPWNR